MACLHEAGLQEGGGYAELQVTSNYSFLIGASHPAELVETAAALGHAAVAITDRNSLAGVVRAHVAAKEAKIKLLVGARLDFADHPSLICLPTDRAAYGRLSQLITKGRRAAPKGECALAIEDLWAFSEGQILIALPPEPDRVDFKAEFKRFKADLSRLVLRQPGFVYLAARARFGGRDRVEINRLDRLARQVGAPLVAVNDVHHHIPGRRALADVLTCIREGCAILEAGHRLAMNAERHLKPAVEMRRLFKDWPEAVDRTLEISSRVQFSLDELKYDYPEELTREGRSPQEELAHLTWIGAAKRWPDGVPEPVRLTLLKELALIEQLGYAPYFLTVNDIVAEARRLGILCQGRGSAANSAVCYVLGITAVDPVAVDLLFERFVSAARNEPPDIDVDFEHERREEIIQYIYRKYGRERAGLAAAVHSFRARGALREVGKAMGLSGDVLDKLVSDSSAWSREAIDPARVISLGLDPSSREMAFTLALARELIGFPRHLSQHVGGFVLTRARLDSVVPIANAAMADRTTIEWDKDDLDALRILKVDVLALGMLTCLRKAFDLIRLHGGPDLTLADVPTEDPKVYDMICRADTVGVFQIESRAQMSMLPRLRPRCFYDLVIEVAIVRPGPIQGDMVHPYLRRRRGEEPVVYPTPELEAVLKKTLGVPLFQEQAMRIAMVAAKFSADDADRLRRAMATFKKSGEIHGFKAKMIEGMVANGYEREFAERCFRQIEGFGTYGFPESHAASFALLVYVSSWVKRWHPAAFCAAILNSQPMGFYAPAQLVRDAREHGVLVRAVDVNRSQWDCTLEEDPASVGGLAVRLGLRMVKGFHQAAAQRLVASRGEGYPDPHALWRRSDLTARDLSGLAAADAFRSMGLDRRAAEWAVRGLKDTPMPLFSALEPSRNPRQEPAVDLPLMPISAQVLHDYANLGLSLKAHPLAFLRDGLAAERAVPCASLMTVKPGKRASVAGLVLVRQRPGTASGVIFMTLEDESGIANLIVWPGRFEEFRRVVLTASLLLATGIVQREGLVVHLIVEKLEDRSHRLSELTATAGNVEKDFRRASRDFH